MASQTTGTFTYYNLSTRETLAGGVLSGDQTNLLQNDLAQIAEQILNLEFSPEHPLLFAQNEAFLKGQMSVVRNMLDRSKVSEQQLRSSPDL